MTAPPPFVAFHVSASGPDIDRDAVLALAAVRFVRGRAHDTFLARVRPEVDPPGGGGSRFPIDRSSSGVRPGDGEVELAIEDALANLGDFVGREPLVAYDLARQLRLAHRHGGLTRARGYDLAELATVLLPAARPADRAAASAVLRLAAATDEAGTGAGTGTGTGARAGARAGTRPGTWAGAGAGDLTDAATEAEWSAGGPLAEALAEGELFLALVARARALGPALLAALATLARRAAWDLAPVFEEAARSPTTTAAGGPSDAGRPAPPAPLARSTRPIPVVAGDLEALIAPGGRMQALVDGFEDRPAQREMLLAVCEAFNAPDQLLVEAGTGTGKSLAYLLPAAAWAIANGRPVVIATHTIALQDQLIHKDLPLTRALLGQPFEACTLKGRANYLCRTRLGALAGRPDLDPGHARTAARLLVWATATATGDRAELALGPDDARVWRAVNAESDSCTAESCAHARVGDCWVHRARARAEGSHVVIVSHALLVSDARVDNRVLPRHGHLIVDEAHHLEGVATDQLGFSASRQRVRDAVASADLAGDRGLLARVAAATAASDLGDTVRAGVWEAVTALRALSARAASDVEMLFARLAECLAAQGQGGGPDVRITAAVRTQPEWFPVETAWDAWHTRATELRSGLMRLAQTILAAESYVVDSSTLIGDLQAGAREVGAVDAGLERAVARPGANDIVWVSRAEADRLSIHHAPLSVADTLTRWLFDDKETLVLTSATLRAGRDFSLLRDRLGLLDAPERVVDSPFDYGRSVLLFVPTNMPAPGDPGYQEALDGTLASLAVALGGRALVLYTSYAGLRESYHRLRSPLAALGITVLGQSFDGSQHQLLEGLRAAARPTMLLGTRSFWEGVDVPGDALSCVVMARLPFDVPTDPVFAARAETFDDPFREYAVPLAVLRFRQGFGRLIRTTTDRGVFAILDGRVRSRTYGHTFLSALPPCQQHKGPLGDLPGVARRFLSGEPAATEWPGLA